MSNMYRGIKHFIVTWENGKILVSRAREVVPNRTYEIVQVPPAFPECAWKNIQLSTPEIQGIGLGEKTKIKSSLS